jgi:hypothetical protein
VQVNLEKIDLPMAPPGIAGLPHHSRILPAYLIKKMCYLYTMEFYSAIKEE